MFADITMALIYVNKECVNQKKYTCQMCVCACNVKRKASCDQQAEGRVMGLKLTEKLCLRSHALLWSECLHSLKIHTLKS